ncbi:head GIN domain-containing protein [Georgenia thermotolerans]|uniref:Putative auto-transporter adhesin head GIN domain-containing protein n=1 Tax=Georgenia thermotolerans TaxID=527326 RepID=A0A7J5ULP6_9MICO|nr:head GIN domain-containing protein [Georgenia thermotolerans]KAE8763298.1 hypothetical protein GB883_14865 [Georgenia thermotolerans]
MTLPKLALLLLAVAPPFALTGCATGLDVAAGEPTTERRDIQEVSAVTLASVGDLHISTGAEPSLTITAGDRVLDRVTSEVRDGTLVLDLEGRFLRNPGRITYDLVLPEVDEIRLDGAGAVDADLAATDRLYVELAGAGDITAHGVDVDDLTVRVDGAGSVTLAGRAGRQDVEIDGVGGYSGEDLTSAAADVTIGGAGDARVHVTDTLAAAVDGAGEIVHTGGARVTSSVSGLGAVRQG